MGPSEPYTGIVLRPDTPRERALVAVLLTCPDSRLNIASGRYSQTYSLGGSSDTAYG